MKVVGRQRLKIFCARHADARPWLEAWLADLESVVLANPSELKARFSSASFLAGNTVVFNVEGNRYRLETTVAYRSGVIVVNWIGTHAAYDRRNKSRKS